MTSVPPTAASGFDVRRLADGDWDVVRRIDGLAFGVTISDEEFEAELVALEADRTFAAYDGDEAVGITSAYSYRMTVPGGELPTAGVTWVGVLPTHRRRGVLTSLMSRQLAEIRERGEPVAALWASEPQIYGRYGYGVASRALVLEVPRSADALHADTPTDASLRLRFVPPDDWKVTAGVYDVVRPQRPGMVVRDERWWQRAVVDLPSERGGASALRCVVAEDDGGVRAYARYTNKMDWGPGVPNGLVDVRELMATDAAAHATILRYLLDQDLVARTKFWHLPVDDPLILWLQNPRRAMPRYGDTLHVRIIDLPSAITGRRYSAPVDVVLDVRDDRIPENSGHWAVHIDEDDVTCTRTDRAADVSVGIASLGSIFLGGVQLAELAAAGRVVEHTPGAVIATSNAFRHFPAPWCPAIF